MNTMKCFNKIEKELPVLWLTGLPCAGKTTLAKNLKQELERRGLNVFHLDGDDLRQKLNADLGFSHQDRKENLRRAAHVSNLFKENGHFVIASFISPQEELRQMLKEIVRDLMLVYVKCSPAICRARDVKGMYAQAQKGKIAKFTGVSAQFEEPLSADVVVDTECNSIEECVEQLLSELEVLCCKRTSIK